MDRIGQDTSRQNNDDNGRRSAEQTPINRSYRSEVGAGYGWPLALFGIGLVGEPALHRLYQRVPQLVDKKTGGNS